MEEKAKETDVLVGRAAPSFELPCVDRTGRDWRTTLADYAGQWVMLVFYPRDFSFVCPTELTAFSARMADFRKRHCQLLGISADSMELHREWLTTAPDEGGLGPLQFPLASDADGALAQSFGVWDREKQVPMRGLFIIDPAGVLQYAVVHNLNVGRNPDETLRVLEGLQTGGLCPASWTHADGTLNLKELLQPGRVLGHYRIRKQLGEGTFGTVFSAWDLHLERIVALKVLFQNAGDSRDALLAEARSAAKLNHPNVCTIYAVEVLEGLPVIVMEYVEGKPLSDLITQKLPGDLVRKIAGQISQALAAAHKIQLVHGDLKPANILVSNDHVCKILDFGLARVLTTREKLKQYKPPPTPTPEPLPVVLPFPQAAEPALDKTVLFSEQVQATSDRQDNLDATRTAPKKSISSLTGTPAYMSPEQASALPTSPASDVFSFGLILFEMLTAQRALNETSLLPLLKRLRTEDFAATLPPQVDPAYREVLGKILAHNPAFRPGMPIVAELLSSGTSPTKFGTS